jgi:hypothetical protein
MCLCIHDACGVLLNNRWTVSHYTASGKPDVLKKLARARPSDYAYAITDPIIAAQHATFTSGDVDLFAFERDDNDNDSNAGVPLQRRRQQQQQQQQHEHIADRSSLNRVLEQVRIHVTIAVCACYTLFATSSVLCTMSPVSSFYTNSKYHMFYLMMLYRSN